MLPGSNFPRICKAWKAKHWQGSNVPEFPKALASMRSADLLETHPCRCFDFRIYMFLGSSIPADVFGSEAAQLT